MAVKKVIFHRASPRLKFIAKHRKIYLDFTQLTALYFNKNLINYRGDKSNSTY